MHRPAPQLAFLVVALWLSGCGILAKKVSSHREATVPTPAADQVDVTGLVERPRCIEIPESGLTLVQALARAGGICR